MLKGKTVVIGVTGSIAAYKIAALCSLLKKQNADVHVIMTKNATNFINPITFETITGNRCLTDTFDRNFTMEVKHVSLAKKADIFVVAPATANTIGKIANGIADDMLTTEFLACKCTKVIVPAMNTNMLTNEIVQRNIDICRSFNIKVLPTQVGKLACGDVGGGKMLEPEDILKYIFLRIALKKDLKGINLLVTGGPTIEPIDPVRFISNNSTGKMGSAIATMAAYRGAKVTYITGPCKYNRPPFCRVINVRTAEEMKEAVLKEFPYCSWVIKSAAVCDYKPAKYETNKIKKGLACISIDLSKNSDIISILGAKKRQQLICGFAMETENLIENAKSKLENKNLDLIVANSLVTKGAGFGTDTNVATIISREKEINLPLMTKEALANIILDQLLEIKVSKGGQYVKY